MSIEKGHDENVCMHSVGNLTTSSCVRNKNICCCYKDFKCINDGVNAILLVLKLVVEPWHAMSCRHFQQAPGKYYFPKASGIQINDCSKILTPGMDMDLAFCMAVAETICAEDICCIAWRAFSFWAWSR